MYGNLRLGWDYWFSDKLSVVNFANNFAKAPKKVQKNGSDFPTPSPPPPPRATVMVGGGGRKQQPCSLGVASVSGNIYSTFVV
jgi:hypothetical protein